MYILVKIILNYNSTILNMVYLYSTTLILYRDLKNTVK